MIYALFFGIAATLIILASVRIASGYLVRDRVMYLFYGLVLLSFTGVGYVVQVT